MSAPFAILAVVIAAIVFSHRTCHFGAVCSNDVAGCSTFNMAKGVEAGLVYSEFSVRHGHLVVSIVCAVRNRPDSARIIDLSHVELLSSDLKMERQTGRKSAIEPGAYDIDPGTEQDVNFVFRSAGRLSEKDAFNKIKDATFYLIGRQTSHADTLIRLRAEGKKFHESVK